MNTLSIDQGGLTQLEDKEGISSSADLAQEAKAFRTGLVTRTPNTHDDNVFEGNSAEEQETENTTSTSMHPNVSLKNTGVNDKGEQESMRALAHLHLSKEDQKEKSPRIATKTATKSLPLRRVCSDSRLTGCTDRARDVRGFGVKLLSAALPRLPGQARLAKYDEGAADKFASSLVNALNDSATCLLISIGHQLGLFSVMSKLCQQPRSPATIAEAACQTRTCYVAEWLSAMTCVGVVEESLHSTDTPGNLIKKYLLPREHGRFLTWNHEADNLALSAQYVPIMGRLEASVVECFKTGRGLSAAHFALYDSVASLDTLQTLGTDFRNTLFVHVSGLHDELVEGLSVLCVGSGNGLAFINMAKLYPNSWFTCYDACLQRTKTARLPLSENSSANNIHFRALTHGLHTMQEKRSYDLAIILDGTSIHNAMKPNETLAAISLALRVRRPLVYHELFVDGRTRHQKNHIAAPFLYAQSTITSLPAARHASGQGLGRMWGHENALKALGEADFSDIQVVTQRNDNLNCVIIAKTGVAEI